MGAGARAEPVTLQRLTRTSDGMGGGVETWADVGLIWCDIKPLRASEAERQGAVRSLSVYQFSADAMSVKAKAASPSDRLVWQGRAYNIRELRTPKSAMPDIDIIAETGA